MNCPICKNLMGAAQRICTVCRDEFAMTVKRQSDGRAHPYDAAAWGAIRARVVDVVDAADVEVLKVDGPKKALGFRPYAPQYLEQVTHLLYARDRLAALLELEPPPGEAPEGWRRYVEGSIVHFDLQVIDVLRSVRFLGQ